MSENETKILDAIWWTTGRAKIGVVVIDSYQGRLKAYMGNYSLGLFSQDKAEQEIARYGAKLLPHIADAMFPDLAGKFIY